MSQLVPRLSWVHSCGSPRSQLVHRSHRQAAERVQRQRRVRRLRSGRPRLDGSRHRHSIGVEQHCHQVGAGDSVDHAVVHFADERPTIGGQPVDHPHLPQRTRSIELLRHQPAHQVLQVMLITWGRERRVPHVVGQVEVGIVDPHRMTQASRHEPDLLPIAGQQWELAFDQRGDVADRRGWAGEDGTRADVHVRDAVFGV